MWCSLTSSHLITEVNEAALGLFSSTWASVDSGPGMGYFSDSNYSPHHNITEASHELK